MASHGYRTDKKASGWAVYWKCDGSCESTMKYGHCKEHFKGGFSTKSQAIAHGKAMHTDALAHGHIAKNIKAPTLAEAAESWLDGRLGVCKSTLDQNTSYVNSLILPDLGHRRIDSITTPMLKEWVKALADNGKAAATIEKAHRNLHQILDTAADDGRVRRDKLPARLGTVNLPKSDQRKVNPTTYDELMLLADVIDPRYRIAVLLGGLAGLRFGEAAGLTADSCAMKSDGPWLNIYRQWNRYGEFAPCKTNSSERVLAISLTLDNELKQHRSAYPTSTEGTLVSAAMGRPLDHSNFHRDVWKPAQKRMAQQIAGWEHRTFHDLRHTYASLLIAAGEHPKVIQNALGHAKLSTTMDIYGHLMDGFGASARSAIDGFGSLKVVPNAEAVA